MEGKAAGAKVSTLQHCNRLHDLCGIHFMERLNGHSGWGLVGEDVVVIQMLKKLGIVKPVVHFQPI